MAFVSKIISPINTKKSKREEVFYDAVQDVAELEGNKRVKFTESSFHVNFHDSFRQKFFDWNLWRVLVGSFFSAVFLHNDWHITAFILFISLMNIFIQWNRGVKARAVEYCAKNLAERPDRLRKFLATVSSPKHLDSGKSGDAPCEWINDIFGKFWPYINCIAQSQMDKQGFSKEGLNIGNGHIINFERFTLGDKPPVITSVHVKKSGKRKDEIAIVLKIIYFGNCLVLFSYKTKVFLSAKAGVKDVYFRGEAVIVLRPLLEFPPFIGGLSICLEEPPLIDYEGINLANLADIQIFKKFLLGMISSYLVSPNRIYVPLLQNPNIKRELKFPLPLGLCFVQVLEAENLPQMDLNKCLVFEGSSDSFCRVKIGSYQYVSTTVYSSLNPYFGQSFSAPIHDFNDILRIEILDKDTVTVDDMMGTIEFKLSEVGTDHNFNGRDKWLPIGGSPAGSLHFRVAVFGLSVERRNVVKILKSIKQTSCKFPVAILSVYIYYVSKLSTADDETNFRPAVDLKFSDQTFRTKSSKLPKHGYYNFEESSHFMCYDIVNEVLEVSVVSQANNQMSGYAKSFGDCDISIKDIIKSKRSNMCLNKEFAIKKTFKLKGVTEVKDSGFVRMFISLKICKYRKRLFENLKIASSIQSNIEQSTTDDNTIAKVFTEPISSIRNPIRTVKTIGYTVMPFTAPKKTIVAEDLLPVPADLGSNCYVKARIKWPDRDALHVEVLRVIQIPLNIVDKSYKYSICVKLSLKAEKKKSEENSQTITEVVKSQLKTQFNKLRNYEILRNYLGSNHTKKQGLDNLTTNVIFNERIIFKLSPLNNIDNHKLEFLLVVHKPRRFFAVTFDSSLVASSAPTFLPVVDFKGDPKEQWYKLNIKKKFLRVKTV